MIILFLENKAISLVNKRWQSRPIFAAHMAVVRQWLLVAAPHAMIVSQFLSTASANKNSSFLTLFPVRSVPVRSSLLMKHFTPSNPKSHGSIGVGPFANRAFIGFTVKLWLTNLRKTRKPWNQPFVDGTDTALGTHFGAIHGRINLIILLLCLLFASIFVDSSDSHERNFAKCLNDLSN